MGYRFWLSIARASARLTARRWRGVRFLCYHSVAASAPAPSDARLTVSADGFRNHLAWFRRNGYVVVAMGEARRLLDTGDAARAQFVCLTFDDGWLDNFAVAWPVLRAAGHSAHFFVNSAVVGGDAWMDAAALRAIVREGGSVGSHARHHVDLTSLGEHELRRELVESRRELEALTGAPIDTHAYPYGAHDARVVRATEAAGYAMAFKVCTGAVRAISERTRFSVPRNAIHTGADNPDNYVIIRGGFDFTRLYTEARQHMRWARGAQ